MLKNIGKTILRCGALLLSLLMLASCSSGKPAEVSSESGISRYTDVPEVTVNDLVYPAVYVRTDIYGEDNTTYPRLVTISTREELEKYTSDSEKIYDFETNAYSVSFYDAVTKYDAAFFENNSLVMALLNEASGSYTHGNRGFSKNESGYTLNLIRFVPSEATDDTAAWHIIFEVPKTSPVLESEIKLDITEENTAA